MLPARFSRPVMFEDELRFCRAVRLPPFEFRTTLLGRLIVLEVEGRKITAHERGGLDFEGVRPIPLWVHMLAESLARNFEAYWNGLGGEELIN